MATAAVPRDQHPRISRNQNAAASWTTSQKVSELGGRLFLVLLFIVAGIDKIGSYEATATYMTSGGVPSSLLPLVIVFEFVGAAAIVIGWRTRIAAVLLAAFTALSTLLFHFDFGDPTQSLMFLKNVGITGGFLLLTAHGAGPLSLDRIGADRTS